MGTEGDRDEVDIPQEVAAHLMQEKYEVVHNMYCGFDYTPYLTGNTATRLGILGGAVNHVGGLPDGKKRYLKAVTELSKAFALAIPADTALAVPDEVGFFQAVRALLVKATTADRTSTEDLDTAIRQLVSRAVAPDEVIDIFDAAGLQRPNIAVLSDGFLEDVKNMPRRNLRWKSFRSY
jgi:type I restriction enzyme R subunit